MIEDRELQVRPDQVVKTAWVAIADCTLVGYKGLHPVAVERAYRKYLQAGDTQFWPPIVGHWDGARFVVCDGRHEFLALMMLERARVLVAWLDDAPEIASAIDHALRIGREA